MALQVTPLENVGVEVSGFDITEPLSDSVAAEMVALWNEHAIVLFRGQNVSPENQITFSRIFGELAVDRCRAGGRSKGMNLHKESTLEPQKGLWKVKNE